jgi:hypothetical protein
MIENDRRNKQANLQERLEIAKQKRLTQYSSGSVEPNHSKVSLNNGTKSKDNVCISTSDSDEDERDGRYGDGCDVVDLSTSMNKLTDALSARDFSDEDSDDDVDIDEYILNGDDPISKKSTSTINKNKITSFKFNNKRLVDVVDANDSKLNKNRLNESSQINTKNIPTNEPTETSSPIEKLIEPTNEVEKILSKDFKFTGVVAGGIDKDAALKNDMRNLMSLLRKNPGSLEE